MCPARSGDKSGQDKIVIHQGRSPDGGTQDCQVVGSAVEAVGWAAPLQSSQQRPP